MLLIFVLILTIMKSNDLEASAEGEYDFENEPPLLEELGVNFDHIRQKTLAVLNPLGVTSKDVIFGEFTFHNFLQKF